MVTKLRKEKDRCNKIKLYVDKIIFQKAQGFRKELVKAEHQYYRNKFKGKNKRNMVSNESIHWKNQRPPIEIEDNGNILSQLDSKYI